MNRDSKNAIYSILQQKNITEECQRAFLCILGSDKQVSEISISDIFGGREESGYVSVSSDLDIEDYRIKTIEFFNFRYFYNGDENVKKNFGINFTRNSNPCSLFMVGGNGTGKSTVFSALELYYTGQSSRASAIRARREDDRYMTYGFGQICTTPFGYNVTTVIDENGQKEHNGMLDNIISAASFCSDLDMQQIEAAGSDLYGYVLNQLGYGDLICLRERLEYISKNLQTSFEIEKNELTSEEWNEIIEAFLDIDASADIDDYKKFCDEKEIEVALASVDSHHEFARRWETLKDVFSSPNVDIMLQHSMEENNLNSVSRLAAMYQELCNCLEKRRGGANSIVDLLDEMYNRKRIVLDKERKTSEMLVPNEDRKEILNILSSLIKEKCDSIVQTTLFSSEHTSSNFVEDVMQRFSPPHETYKFRYEGGMLSLKITVNTPNGSFEASPQEYLNTFRFKLFCLTLKITVAFGKMKERNTMAPIVIDDVLDASDFENTIKLEQFVYRLYKTYDEKLGYFGRPLQLVLLTHDDMVQTAFRKGVSLRIMECGDVKPSYYNGDIFICGRLFDKDECAKEFKDSEFDFINVYLKN